ncbi:MAG: dTMP kinase [Balneolaceae bacterium]|nr:dTMP kinase [Balneolaceae bacterium]
MLITFEGIDGCGKSTQIDLLKSYLDKKGVTYNVFREPGGTDLSEKIRNLLLHDSIGMDPVTEMLLFSSARSELISEKVIPLLEAGNVVILDRFYDSTTAYQGYGRQSLPIDQILTLNRIASHGLVPGLTFYLRISPDEASRRTDGSDKDRMEKSGISFFEKVSAGYDELEKKEKRFVTLDAKLTPDQIHAKIREKVDPLLNL